MRWLESELVDVSWSLLDSNWNRSSFLPGTITSDFSLSSATSLQHNFNRAIQSFRHRGPNHSYFIHIHRHEVDSVWRTLDTLTSPEDADHIDVWLGWSKPDVILLLVDGSLANSDGDFPYSITVADGSELTVASLWSVKADADGLASFQHRSGWLTDEYFVGVCCLAFNSEWGSGNWFFSPEDGHIVGLIRSRDIRDVKFVWLNFLHFSVSFTRDISYCRSHEVSIAGISSIDMEHNRLSRIYGDIWARYNTLRCIWWDDVHLERWILHGSRWPQNADREIIKLRWSDGDEELLWLLYSDLYWNRS